MSNSQKRFRQLGKKLLHPNARLKADGSDTYVLMRMCKVCKRQAELTAVIVDDWRKADWFESDGSAFRLSSTRRAHLRRHEAGEFAAQHALIKSGDEKNPIKLATTPLQWLQARGRSKALGLNDMELEAGGRLHSDFHRAMRSPHQTMDWSRPVFVDGGTAAGSGDISVSTLDAQKRLAKALAYVGPGLADMAVDVCCSEIGLEATEKKFALPRRSAKIMLKLALMRLSVYYGYQSASAAAASFRMR